MALLPVDCRFQRKGSQVPRCIFCFDPLDDSPRADHNKVPSEEHIIPNALGGSRDCSTMDVCRECNSTLGDSVDSAFINHPLTAMLRHQFNTPGYSGTVPDIVLPTRSMDNGEPGRIIFRSDATVTIRHEPTVIRDKKNDCEEILVAGHPDDVGHIFTGIINKSLNKATPEQKTTALSALDAAIEKAVPEVSTLYKVPIEIDLSPINRGLIKISFEFLHVLFGWNWTDSADAVSLRSIARGGGGKAEINLLLQGIAVGFRHKLPLDESSVANHHIIAFLPGKSNMIFVSLFGEPLFTIGVKIKADLDQLCEKMRPDQGVMVSIDPRTKITTWVSMRDFAAKLVC